MHFSIEPWNRSAGVVPGLIKEATSRSNHPRPHPRRRDARQLSVGLLLQTAAKRIADEQCPGQHRRPNRNAEEHRQIPPAEERGVAERQCAKGEHDVKALS